MEGLNVDQTNLKKSLPASVGKHQLLGGSARRVKRFDRKVENKMRTFILFDPNANELKVYQEPAYAVLKAAINTRFAMKDLLHPELFRRRSSWNHAPARTLFPPLTRPVFDANGQIVDEVQEQQTPYDAARECRDILHRASLDITEAKKYIYKWSDFERDQYESNEVDRMLEGYQRKSGILALAISLLLERDAIKEKIYHQWIDSITLALTKWNEVGMNKYKANQSEKTIREAWVIFREYRVFPNTVESRLRAGPPLLRYNPDLRLTMKRWGNRNLKTLNPATFKEHFLEVALPAYVEVLKDEVAMAENQNLPPRLPNKLTADTLSVEGLMSAYNCKVLSVSTLLNWMDYVGYV